MHHRDVLSRTAVTSIAIGKLLPAARAQPHPEGARSNRGMNITALPLDHVKTRQAVALALPCDAIDGDAFDRRAARLNVGNVAVESSVWARSTTDVATRRDVQGPMACFDLRPAPGLLTQPVSCIVLPVATVPLWDPGPTAAHLPIGVRAIAAPWREDLCLRVAHVLEAAGAVAATTGKGL
jgi:Asp-tRNA(Asn)/Glu-tRNA(Gln) amidotransferase A subunit family amidase